MKITTCPFGCDDMGLVEVDGQLENCPLCGGFSVIPQVKADEYAQVTAEYEARGGHYSKWDVAARMDQNRRINEREEVAETISERG